MIHKDVLLFDPHRNIFIHPSVPLFTAQVTNLWISSTSRFSRKAPMRPRTRRETRSLRCVLRSDPSETKDVPYVSTTHTLYIKDGHGFWVSKVKLMRTHVSRRWLPVGDPVGMLWCVTSANTLLMSLWSNFHCLISYSFILNTACSSITTPHSEGESRAAFSSYISFNWPSGPLEKSGESWIKQQPWWSNH